MNILAIETSQPDASLCLSLNGQIAFESSWQAERNHDAYLFPALQGAMEALGGQKLDLILIGAGPGSYGGVRVALAAGVGISVVKKAAIVAYESWAQLAQEGEAIISDARRGGWTLRRPDGRIEVCQAAELKQLAEEGLRLSSIETEDCMAKQDFPVQRYGLRPTAEGLLQSWLALTPEQRKACAAKAAEPIYVRPPHIVPAKHKPWEIRS